MFLILKGLLEVVRVVEGMLKGQMAQLDQVLGFLCYCDPYVRSSIPLQELCSVSEKEYDILNCLS